jgi:acetone carboxylase gamma subunit
MEVRTIDDDLCATDARSVIDAAVDVAPFEWECSMRDFLCPNCGLHLAFENSVCLSCGSALGFS